MKIICSSSDDSIGIGTILIFESNTTKVDKDDDGFVVTDLNTSKIFRCYDVVTVN